MTRYWGVIPMRGGKEEFLKGYLQHWADKNKNMFFKEEMKMGECAKEIIYRKGDDLIKLTNVSETYDFDALDVIDPAAVRFTRGGNVHGVINLEKNCFGTIKMVCEAFGVVVTRTQGLQKYSTKELVEELIKREGIEGYQLKNYYDTCIIPQEGAQPIVENGPGIHVLVVKD